MSASRASGSRALLRALRPRPRFALAAAPRVSAGVSTVKRSIASSAKVAVAPSPPSSAAPSSSPSAPAPAAAAAAATEAAAPAAWHPTSRRVGLIAFKRGMTSYFLPSGVRVPATLIQLASCQVSAHIGFSSPTAASAAAAAAAGKAKPKTRDGEPYHALQIAAVDARSVRGVSAQVRGHLQKAGVGPKKVLREFRVSKDACVPLGATLSPHHFVPGQHVDVRAITRGKGFQGGMKRHGFKGLRASHGVSISHRSLGSTGQHQDPGRVFPGKKMAGRMGGTAHRTVQNLRVLRIDERDSTLLVSGHVPGPEGGVLTLVDAKKALVGAAAHAWAKGKTLDGQLADGKEAMERYLKAGITGLPFPAATTEMSREWPKVVEVGEL